MNLKLFCCAREDGRTRKHNKNARYTEPCVQIGQNQFFSQYVHEEQRIKGPCNSDLWEPLVVLFQYLCNKEAINYYNGRRYDNDKTFPIIPKCLCPLINHSMTVLEFLMPRSTFPHCGYEIIPLSLRWKVNCPSQSD